MISNIVDILVLSTLAGLATGLGGLIALVKKPGKKTLGFLMGSAAGIMITISFLELMSEASKIYGLPVAAIGFVAGSLSMFVLDFLLPHKFFSVDEKGMMDGRVLRSSILIAIGISLHNFPEGIAVASGYSYLPRLGVVITIAMALHNIPEGMAISLAMRIGGGSKSAALKLALISGLAEPLGAMLASLFLGSSPLLVPFALSFASGVMVFVTLDELIPVAHERGHEHFTSLGVIMGCIATFMLLGTLS
jgi:ZIP family zinc transporter